MCVGFVKPAVAANQPVVGIGRVYPDAVVVYVFVFFAGWLKVFAAVCAVVHVGIHGEYFVDVIGVTDDFLVVVAARGERSLFGPCFAFIARAEYAAFVVACLYDGINHIGIGRRNRQAHAAHVAFRQATVDFFPGCSAIC